MRRRPEWCTIALLFLAACASSGSGGASALFQRNIGNASRPDAMDRSLRIVHQFQYEVFRQDEGANIRIETHWKPRLPFEDEQVLGITAAETRLIITAILRNDLKATASYDVNLTVENRVRTGIDEVWNETTVTDMFREYADRITQEFKRELMIGVRRD
jgi:hypothetical protein